MKKKIISVILLITLFFITGCAQKEKIEKDKLTIVTTVFPYYDFAKQVAGEKAEVLMLLPAGAEAHSYEPTMQDVIKINECDLFIHTGKSADPWTESIYKDSGKSNHQILSAINVIGEYGDAPDDSLYSHDEHVWTSLDNAEDIVEAICDKLSSIDPANRSLYRKNAEIYGEKLEKLDDKLENITKIQNRKVVFADRFPFKYFADDYDLEYFAAFPGCSSESEPSAATVSQLINIIKKEKIDIVFYTETSNQKLADTICEETGADKLLLHSCHTVSKEQLNNGVSYLELMNNNYKALKEALK